MKKTTTPKAPRGRNVSPKATAVVADEENVSLQLSAPPADEEDLEIEAEAPVEEIKVLRPTRGRKKSAPAPIVPAAETEDEENASLSLGAAPPTEEEEEADEAMMLAAEVFDKLTEQIETESVFYSAKYAKILRSQVRAEKVLSAIQKEQLIALIDNKSHTKESLIVLQDEMADRCKINADVFRAADKDWPIEVLSYSPLKVVDSRDGSPIEKEGFDAMLAFGEFGLLPDNLLLELRWLARDRDAFSNGVFLDHNIFLAIRSAKHFDTDCKTLEDLIARARENANTEQIEEVAKMIGKSLVVDERSLIGRAPDDLNIGDLVVARNGFYEEVDILVKKYPMSLMQVNKNLELSKNTKMRKEFDKKGIDPKLPFAEQFKQFGDYEAIFSMSSFIVYGTTVRKYEAPTTETETEESED